MADIAQTLKREPNHLGALMGMGMILEARGKREDALKVYERVLDDRAALAQRPRGGGQAQGGAGRQRALARCSRAAGRGA